MKRIISIVAVALLSAGVTQACMKKSAAFSEPLTVIVMDSTQALLDGAEVKMGKAVYRTSFDGRVVIKPEQRTARSINISCNGFQSMKVNVENDRTAVVQLRSKGEKEKRSKEEKELRSRGGRVGAHAAKTEAFLMTDAVAKADMTEDGRPDMSAVDRPAIKPAYTAEEHETVRPVYNRNTNVAAGQLTAGEVNDFAKWRLWESYYRSSADDQRTWGLAPSERYTVQVTDRHGYPIVNYPVSLTDAKGNTVFQTVTDNTGRAELWNGLTGKRVQELRSEGVKELRSDEINAIEVDEPCEAPDGVDVLFVFDATGSMGDELNYLQAEMKDVIRRAKDATGGLAIRTGAVVYRDHGDEYLTRLSRLNPDITVTQAFIDQQEASGGGDYPEAVPEALMAAVNSAGWDSEARARIAFLILDAPCHDDSVTLNRLHEQVLNAAAFGIRIVPVVCSGIGKSAEYLLRSIALATNGTSFFLTDDSGIGKSHLKPTTDTLKVEHLNDMLVRTIAEFSYMPDCVRGKWHDEEIENIHEEFVPNPFSAAELADDPSIPHGPTTLYLLDVTGKLIRVYNGVLDEAGDRQLSSLGVTLSTGIYFVKAFYDGEWHTKKILVH